MHWFIQSRTHPHIQQFERDRGLKTCMPKKKPTPMQSHPKIFPTPCLQQIIPCYFLRRKYFFPPALFFKTCFPPRLKPFCPPFCFENEKILFRLKTNFFFFRKKKKKKNRTHGGGGGGGGGGDRHRRRHHGRECPKPDTSYIPRQHVMMVGNVIPRAMVQAA